MKNAILFLNFWHVYNLVVYSVSAVLTCMNYEIDRNETKSCKFERNVNITAEDSFVGSELIS